MRFDPDSAAELVAAARTDSGISQAALADASGMSQPNIAQIESGKRRVSSEVLERILRAADYRPSVAVERFADEIIRAAAEVGLSDLRLFGSITEGTDTFTSDIDFLVKAAPGTSYFEIGAFAAAVEKLTGFETDVIIDSPTRPKFLDDDELVPL